MNITDTTKPRQSIPSKRLLPRLEFKQCIVLCFFVANKKTLTGKPARLFFWQRSHNIGLLCCTSMYFMGLYGTVWGCMGLYGTV